jgi:hypothetical protein
VKAATVLASSVGGWLNKAKNGAMYAKNTAQEKYYTEEVKEKLQSGINRVNTSGIVTKVKSEIAVKQG